MAKLPAVTSQIPRDLRIFLDRVREALDTGGPDAVITARQLVASGLATYTGNVIGPPGSTVYSAPSTPQNVEAEGALASIIVTWDKPAYKGHSYAEIWASAQTPEQETSATSPTIGEAQLVGMSPGVFFAHNLGAAAKRWYWVRFVNFAGEAGPYQSTEGVVGETSLDPEYILELLTGEITESQLYSTLSDRISLIDSDATVAGSVAARVAAEATVRASQISAEGQARTAALAAEATARGTAITAEQNDRQSADDALAQSITTLTSSVSGNTSAIQTEASARSSGDSALASDITSLDSRLTTAEGGVTGNAIAVTGLDTRVTTAEGEITANASDITSLDSRLTTAEGGVTGNAIAVTGLDTRVTTAEGEITANASDITSLVVSVGGNTAAVQTEALARATADGALQAQYTVKVDANGYVAGFGLANTVNDATPTSEFAVRADKFAIASPSGPGVTPSEPFFVRTTPTTINGESVPAGVYVKDAFIANGTITNAKIGDAVIDDAKIANIDAAKITTGFLDASRIEAGSVDASMIDSRGLSIKDASGNIVLAAGSPLAVGNVSGLGALATADDITMASVTDAGALATVSQITNANISTYIASAAIELAHIDVATITTLASISANMGTITAGVLKSSDNKFVIDLNNKSISIET
jgi:hypothetical protein